MGTSSFQTINCLKVEFYDNVFQKYPLIKDINIGREEDNNIALSDLSISGYHAVIKKENNRVWVEDLGSTNGTLVNDIAVNKKHLKNGDMVMIGQLNIRCIAEEKTELPSLNLSDIETIEQSCIIKLNSTEEQIEQFMKVFEATQNTILKNAPEEAISKYIKEALKNAYEHGNKKEQSKKITIQMVIEPEYFKIMIEDEGNGFNYRDYYKNHKTETSLIKLPHYFDSVEYNFYGNQITLSKGLQTFSTQRTAGGFSKKNIVLEKHLTVKHNKTMNRGKSFPVDVVISDEAIKTFPEYIDGVVGEFHKSATVQVIPVFPGCICSPSFRDLNLGQSQNNARFWVTPISGNTSRFSIDIVNDGHLTSSLAMPIKVKSSKVSKTFFLLAFLFHSSQF